MRDFVDVKSPLVVGYKGEIGSFLLHGLLRVMSKALNIWCVDISESQREVKERIRKSDVIFLCVPLGKTVEWVKKHKSLLRNKIIVEQTSVKEPIIKKLSGFNILSMHILFRPSATSLTAERQVALVISKEWPYSIVQCIELITQGQLVIYDSIEAHDRSMANQQAIPHQVILKLDKMMELDTEIRHGGRTYIGWQIRKLAKRIQAGDKELYKAIQRNKYIEDF